MRLPPTNHCSGPTISDEPGTVVPETEVVEETKLYPRYKVFVHNDDITPAQLVVELLRGVFGLNARRAVEVMVEAHNTGVAFVIALTLEQAEFRVEQAHSLARGRGYPLTFSFESE